ncbi:hypothetical protein FCV25MIE_15492 [Fagus crenata]
MKTRARLVHIFLSVKELDPAEALNWVYTEAVDKLKAIELAIANALKAVFSLNTARPLLTSLLSYPPGTVKAAAKETVAMSVATNTLVWPISFACFLSSSIVVVFPASPAADSFLDLSSTPDSLRVVTYVYGM